MVNSTKNRPPWVCSLTLFALLAVAPHAYPQGCAQCREAIGQTPARTRQAYRRGIETLVFAAGIIFTASLVLIRRYR